MGKGRARGYTAHFFFWKCAKSHIRQCRGQKIFHLRRAFVRASTIFSFNSPSLLVTCCQPAMHSPKLINTFLKPHNTWTNGGLQKRSGARDPRWEIKNGKVNKGPLYEFGMGPPKGLIRPWLALSSQFHKQSYSFSDEKNDRFTLMRLFESLTDKSHVWHFSKRQWDAGV